MVEASEIDGAPEEWLFECTICSSIKPESEFRRLRKYFRFRRPLKDFEMRKQRVCKSCDTTCTVCEQEKGRSDFKPYVRYTNARSK